MRSARPSNRDFAEVGGLISYGANPRDAHRQAAPPSSVMNSPPFHSITSSARPESGSGTVMPSALADLRLM
jgi:hypothetical protein